MNRPITVSELIQALLELNQPHARVEVRGGVLCDIGPNVVPFTMPFTQTVTSARSELNRVVLEVAS